MYTRMDDTLHLDLFNFEEPGAEKSNYILTSPRSLEACSRFGIQPVELLSKPLSDFQDDGFGDYQSYAHQDHAMEQYQQYEKQRRRKLRLCREERERIIVEQRAAHHSSARGTLSPCSLTEDAYSENTDPRAGKISGAMFSSQDGIVEGRQEDTLYCRSPATRSSGYGSGLLKYFTEHFDEDIPASRNHLRYHRPASPSDRTKSTPVAGKSAKRRNRESGSYLHLQSEDEGSKSDNNLPSRRKSSTRNFDFDRSRASLGSIGTMLPSHLVRSIEKLSEKDEKLLRVLINKVEDEKLEKQRQLYDQLGRMEEKRVMDEMREIKARQHRMLLADRMRDRDQQRELMRRQQKLKEDIERECRVAMIRRKEESWHQEYRKQADAKSSKEAVRRFEHQEKKQSQEVNLARSDLEREAHFSTAHLVSVDRLKEAERKRNYRLSNEKRKNELYNAQEKERYELRKELMARQMREQEALLKKAIHDRNMQADLNARFQTKQREMELLQSRIRQQVKKEQQEYHILKMEEDLAQWKEELRQLQEMNQSRAQRQARRVIEEKSQRAYEHRKIKEQDHALNLARVEREHEHRRQEIKEIINVKNQKSRHIIQNKEMSAKESREAARASRALRDAVREQTIKSSFDKMAEEAQRLARMEQVRGYHVNGSRSSQTFR